MSNAEAQNAEPLATASQRPQRLFVVGASEGGITAFQTLLEAISPEFPGAIVLVVHLAPGRSVLAEILSRTSRLPVAAATDGAMLTRGEVLVAVPDFHLIVEDGLVHLTRGPRENSSRPAIDPLFRSAAVNYGRRAVGVVLTGNLDDGAAGLAAIKAAGGKTIVQAPADALIDEMPRNALAAVEPDYCIPIREMPGIFQAMCATDVPDNIIELPALLRWEANLAKDPGNHLDEIGKLGESTSFGCPDCGGPLWKLEKYGPDRYRCHVGHGYTDSGLLRAQSEQTERALTVSLRTLEEKARMYEQMLAKTTSPMLMERFEEQANAMKQNAETVRSLLQHIADGGGP